MAAQRVQEEEQQKEWIARGRALSLRDKMQRNKIRDVVGEKSKRIAEMTALVKQEEVDYARNLRDVRLRQRQQNRAQAQRVREETADAIIDGSKGYAFEQRSCLALSTRTAERVWREERDENTKSHLAKAKANKAAAEASRARAKQLRAQIEETRRREASRAREHQKAQKAQKDRQVVYSAGGIKDTHDTVYKRRYVPAGAAESMLSSRFCETVA